MFSSRGLESCPVDVFIDMAVDDGQRLAQCGRGLWLVSGGEGSEQAVAELGVEDGEALPVGGQHVGVGVLDPADEAVEAQAAQVVSCLAGAVGGAEQPGGQGTQALVGDAAGAEQGQGQGAGPPRRRMRE
jgi:hypothetical protein